MADYQPQNWERATSVAAATLGVGVVIYVVIRNQPFNDPNLAAMTRIILSLSVAVLGATIPGFLNVDWSASGFVIRAGGALALFVLTYFATPTVLKTSEDTTGPTIQQSSRGDCSPNFGLLIFGKTKVDCNKSSSTP